MSTKNYALDAKFIPLAPFTKKPLHSGWTNNGVDYGALASYGIVGTDINVGVLTGAQSDGLIDIDLDGPNTIEAAAFLLPSTNLVMGRNSRPSSHWFYQVSGDTKTTKFHHPVTNEMLVEYRGDGCQTMMAGSIHPDGETVRFESGKAGEPSSYPSVLVLSKAGQVATASVLMNIYQRGARHNVALLFAGLCAFNNVLEEDCRSVIETLASIANDEELSDRIDAIQTTYKRKADRAPIKWLGDLERMLGSEQAPTIIANWMRIATTGTLKNTRRTVVANENSQDAYVGKFETDIEIAECFHHYQGDTFLYADHENTFFRKINGVYDPITLTEMRNEVAIFLKGPACGSERIASENRKSMQSIGRIKAVTEICKGLMRADDRQFDRDDYLIGTKNGVLDLSTFRLVEPQGIVTKRIGTNFVPTAKCPRFEQFLDQVFQGDVEKIAYLRRAIGYSLTGVVDAQVMFILTGRGANGKSVLLNLLSALMGNYGGAIPTHSITQQKYGNDKTDDIASLVGKRFVQASEGDANDKLATAKVKRLVAGDKLPVRRLYGSYFDMQPQFKLWFGSNELPQVNANDYATWRRIHIIEFHRSFASHEQDPKLYEKLSQELPGILNWALDGLRDMDGMRGNFLRPPASVLKSVEEYRSQNDNTSRFIAENCVKDPSALTSVGDLYNNYKTWCYDNAVEPIASGMFGKELTSMGFEVVRKSSCNYRKGLRLR